MKIFDLMELDAQMHDKRAANVFFKNETFKTRVIVLEPGGEIPECDMESYVIFYVVKGEVTLNKNEETSILAENQVFITEPAALSMKSDGGARLMGVQIEVRE